MAPRKGRVKKEGGTAGTESGCEDSDEYRKKRDRNNLVKSHWKPIFFSKIAQQHGQAVKRSRVKSKQKTQETLNRVNKLRNENTVLEEKVKTLTKELGFLKELFLAHAANNVDPSKFEGIDLKKLLTDDASTSGSGSKT